MTRLTDIVISDEVLNAACAGGEAARQAIYSAVAPATLTLIRRLVGQRALADDIFQDTMMTFYECLPRFRREAPLGAWLRRIAVSRCLMYLRSPWRRALLSLEPVDGEIAAAVTALVTPGYSGELIDVERALATLSSTARAVVWMYEVEGYSHEEIAREFGRSVSFSKSQLARAHARLRAWFEPREQRESCTLI
ncbi:MAG: RNA polymerase sigma factor [Gammaproteobacteria bacterium]|nr:RNA polymerase sigma factor [Gammaproteobacteria bacterium]